MTDTADDLHKAIEYLQRWHWNEVYAAAVKTVIAEIERLRAEPPQEAVRKAVAALEEAEAILGGEYGDHYGVLCQRMIDLREALTSGAPRARPTIDPPKGLAKYGVTLTVDPQDSRAIDPYTLEKCAEVVAFANDYDEAVRLIRALGKEPPPTGEERAT